MRTFLFVMYFVFFPAIAQSAEIQCVDENNVFKIRVQGVIDTGDATRFRNCTRKLNSQKRSFSFVSITSKGGLVSEAMQIGREIRKSKLSILVPIEGECLSSCVFIFAGGIDRTPAGTIGIHRPYFLKPPKESYDATLKAMLKDAEAYFYEMNIPERLAQDMFSVSPEQMRILDREALKAYRLDQPDMAFTEERIMSRAASLGMSRQEYEMRANRAKQYREQCLQTHETPDSLDATIDCSIKGIQKAGIQPPARK